MIHLTRREREVAVCLLLGLSSADMAARLLISRRTIEDYRLQLLKKFEVTDTLRLVVKLWATA